MISSLNSHCRRFAAAALAATLFLPASRVVAEEADLRGVLLSAEQVSKTELDRAEKAGRNAVVLSITAQDAEMVNRELRAIDSILARGMRLYYWIEIARNPQLADAHPKWMASLQGHQQWRRLFPDFPQPAQDNTEIVKNYPWVPILYREGFDAHLHRVEKLLRGKPQARGILLNDLQGAPSACGCGNILCRWTADYGPIKTATTMGDDAATRFVAQVRGLVPESEVIPVWVTECEEHDGSDDGACAGVGCFRGICWKAYTRQLMPLVEQAASIGVLLPVRDFQRELPRFEEVSGWTAHALGTFQTVPPQRDGKAVAGNRLIAVLQGWDVDEDLIAAQVSQARQAGVGGYIIARSKIEQSWRPRLVKR